LYFKVVAEMVQAGRDRSRPERAPMLATRLTDFFGLERPIVLAPMAGGATNGTIVDDRRRHHAPHRVREWMAGGR
jgi:hypothetical protein